VSVTVRRGSSGSITATGAREESSKPRLHKVRHKVQRNVTPALTSPDSASRSSRATEPGSALDRRDHLVNGPRDAVQVAVVEQPGVELPGELLQ
jgi:hypothetical protein